MTACDHHLPLALTLGEPAGIGPDIALLAWLCSVVVVPTPGRRLPKSLSLDQVREAILEIVAELYVNRGDGPEEISAPAQALLAPYRIFKL